MGTCLVKCTPFVKNSPFRHWNSISMSTRNALYAEIIEFYFDVIRQNTWPRSVMTYIKWQILVKCCLCVTVRLEVIPWGGLQSLVWLADITVWHSMTFSIVSHIINNTTCTYLTFCVEDPHLWVVCLLIHILMKM